MISSAFKGAYQNEVSQRTQGINTISKGVTDAGIAIVGALGFTGTLGSGTFADVTKHALANRVGGIGGNLMLATMEEKKETTQNNKAFTAEEVGETIKSQLGDNPINRSAMKSLGTVFETLQKAKEEKIIGKDGMIESNMGKIDPNSPLGKKIIEGFEDYSNTKNINVKDPTLTISEDEIMLDDENKSNFDKTQLENLKKRGISGDALLDANDLAREILDVGGEITKDGKVRVFHATTPENAKEINRTGQMFGKEDKIYFSTKRDGEIKGYGNAIVEAEIPIEKLQANDLFTDEIHLTMDTGVPGRRVNIREESK